MIHFPTERILRNVNKATYEAYKLANLHIIRMLSLNEMPILDKTFFYNCLSSVSYNFVTRNHKTKNNNLIDSLYIYDSYKPAGYRQADSSLPKTYFDDVADQMYTACNNNFSANFYNHLRKYILKPGNYGMMSKHIYF